MQLRNPGEGLFPCAAGSPCSCRHPRFRGFSIFWRCRSTFSRTTTSPYRSCAIITTDASDSVRDVHDRMPLILKPDAYGGWLDPENEDAEWMAKVLKTGSVKDLQRYPVSTRVNRVENNSKACLEPLEKR
ncbi:MAG: SOS response-associated peptidase [Desulfobacterales bacterium]|nr:SOS response-associated peptidase [Desulfobacterales bacterium]